MDLVADQFADGRRFRSLTIVDIYTRECLTIDSEQRLEGEDVVLARTRIKIQRPTERMRMAFSRPGKPPDNAFVESFKATFRTECLNAHWFASLTEAQQIVEIWRWECNESRPHRALRENMPHEFADEIAASRDFIGMQKAENSP
jgi:putative transposase